MVAVLVVVVIPPGNRSQLPPALVSIAVPRMWAAAGEEGEEGEVVVVAGSHSLGPSAES
jgi:hypothetical protein